MKYRTLVLVAGFLSTASHTVLAAASSGLPDVFRAGSTGSVTASTGVAPMDPTQHPIGLSCPLPFLRSSASNVTERLLPAVFWASGSSASVPENITTMTSGGKRRAGCDETAAPESLVPSTSTTSTTASAVSRRPRADSELDLDELALALQDLGLNASEKQARK